MMTANKKSTIRSSSPSKDKCLVTDSSEGGSIVSYSKKKRKGSSIPVAIVTKKGKKNKNKKGDNHNRAADNGNVEARKDEWDSGAESDPEGSESDESNSEDSRSDIDDEEFHNSSSKML